MKRKAVAALLVSVALAATGCGQKETKTTEAETKATEVVTETQTEAATTEEATTEAAAETETESEAASEEATTEEATTEAAAETETESEAASEEATTEETTTEAAAETETESEAASEEATTEEATTEAVTETETESEAASEEETTEEATTEAVTETETESEAASEEATTEEATTEAVTETETESEAASEEATTEEATTEAATEAVSETEAESESETELEEISLKDTPRYEALDYVKLGEYKGLTVVQEPIEITDEELQSAIDSETIETLTEGTVEEGDIANIDYEGKIDDVAFDGGTAEGYDLEIGSDSFIEGFEDGLVGLEIGAETDLYLTFPENYHSEDVAGKEVVFHVKVNSVQRVPELTDEVAAKAAEGMTAEEYKESMREKLVDAKADVQLMETKYQLLTMAYENAEISGYPAEKLEFNMKYAKYQYTVQAQNYGMTFEDLLSAYGITEEDLTAQLEENYKEVLTQEMVLLAIAETENLEVTDEEYDERMAGYCEELATDEATLVDIYGEEWLKDQMRLDMAMDFLVENANIVDEEETESEEATEAVTEQASEEETASEAASEEVTEQASEAETESETASETVSEETSEAESETAESESETAGETVSETEQES